MKKVRTIAASVGIAATLGVGALGFSAGTAGADPGWGHGRGHGPGHGQWAPPPAPPTGWGYGHGGFGPCITGPYGFVHICG